MEKSDFLLNVLKRFPFLFVGDREGERHEYLMLDLLLEKAKQSKAESKQVICNNNNQSSASYTNVKVRINTCKGCYSKFLLLCFGCYSIIIFKNQPIFHYYYINIMSVHECTSSYMNNIKDFMSANSLLQL